MHLRKLLSSPGRTILFSMIITITLGTLLLSSDWAQAEPISLLDCLFTATSATCVTGLLTVPLDFFTTEGHAVILCLIQIGGLGLITLTMFLLSLFINLGLATNLMTGEALEIDSSKQPKYVVFFIIGFTAIIELIGFISIFFALRAHYPLPKAIFVSLFQAISAFCNSGFTLIPFTENSLSTAAHTALLSCTGILVLIGGVGFIVWEEFVQYVRSRSLHKHFHFSLHTKLVLVTTSFLVALTSIVIFLLEYLHDFLMQPSLSAPFAALFNGICLRSAGFTTIEFSTLHLATLFLIMLVSFIGSSPGSTGSGIKTTTFAVFIGAIRATLSRRTWVEIMGRTIPNDQVFKAMAIFSLSLCWIAVIIFCLLITEQGWRFIDITFEAFSAFTNLGITTRMTPHLSTHGKLLISLSMLVGRIGSLTLLLAFKKHQTKVGFHYPEERVVMG
jgi:trk system potassium uptake protein TrkH